MPLSTDQAVILAAADYLKAYAIDTLIVSFLFCYIGFFNGCGKTKFVMVQGIASAFGVRIPVSYLVSQMEKDFIRYSTFPIYNFRYSFANSTTLRTLPFA